MLDEDGEIYVHITISASQYLKSKMSALMYDTATLDCPL